MKTQLKILFGFLAIALALAACGTTPTGDQVMSQQVNQQQMHYATVQPIPWFDYSLDRYLLIQLYKSKNNAVQTFSVVFNEYLGTITFQCASIGYPIPGGTELDNPWQAETGYTSNSGYWAVAIGQAEPNGVFPPSTSAGTYVMCLNADGTIGPVYSEPNVLTFPYPVMVNAGHELVQVPGSTTTIKIDYSANAIRNESQKDAQSIPAVQPTPGP